MSFQPKTKLPYDPRLKACAVEIKAVLDKYSAGGAISLASDTHTEFLIHFPAWSLVGIGPDGHLKVRIRGGEENERTAASLHVLFSLGELSEKLAREFERITAYVVRACKDKGTKINHAPIDSAERPLTPDSWPSGEQAGD
jgi:hypothetical protein